MLIELAKMGKTIFFSSHILADVSEICTHIGIIEAGQMVIQGPINELRKQLKPHRAIVITLLGQLDEAKEAIRLWLEFPSSRYWIRLENSDARQQANDLLQANLHNLKFS